ncbi:hypothetical protein DFQ30_005163, partial [Apophysomyces sp. BC1015]
METQAKQSSEPQINVIQIGSSNSSTNIIGNNSTASVCKRQLQQGEKQLDQRDSIPIHERSAQENRKQQILRSLFDETGVEPFEKIDFDAIVDQDTFRKSVFDAALKA